MMVATMPRLIERGRSFARRLAASRTLHDKRDGRVET